MGCAQQVITVHQDLHYPWGVQKELIKTRLVKVNARFVQLGTTAQLALLHSVIVHVLLAITVQMEPDINLNIRVHLEHSTICHYLRIEVTVTFAHLVCIVVILGSGKKVVSAMKVIFVQLGLLLHVQHD